MPEYCLISLNGKSGEGKFARVSPEDYKAVSQFKWYISGGYAVRYVREDGVKKAILMHRQVLGLIAGDGVCTDHANSNRLDNRRENIRTCTHEENMRNRRLPAHNTSGYKGVTKHHKKWRAKIGANGKRIILGDFDDPKEAARAYDKAARFYHGDYANVNF